jgi:hypothetical protein
VNRRHFVTLLGGLAIGQPLAAYGQQLGAPARLGAEMHNPAEIEAVFFDRMVSSRDEARL